MVGNSSIVQRRIELAEQVAEQYASTRPSLEIEDAKQQAAIVVLERFSLGGAADQEIRRVVENHLRAIWRKTERRAERMVPLEDTEGPALQSTYHLRAARSLNPWASSGNVNNPDNPSSTKTSAKPHGSGFLRSLREVRASAVIEVCNTHPKHAAHVRHATQSRALVAASQEQRERQAVRRAA